VAALNGLRGARMFNGFRGAAAANRQRIAEVVVAIGNAVLELGADLKTLEINPLYVNGDSVEALDALLVWNTVGRQSPLIGG
jgi:hypothetical protein